MLRRAINGEPLMLFGDGNYLRDYTHLDDVVEAFGRALGSDRVRDGGHYVIATGYGCTLADAFRCIAQEAYRETGREVEIRHVPEPPNLHAIERSNFIGDSGLFRKWTGWRSQVDLMSGIRDYFQHSLRHRQAVGSA